MDVVVVLVSATAYLSTLSFSFIAKIFACCILVVPEALVLLYCILYVCDVGEVEDKRQRTWDLWVGENVTKLNFECLN